MLAAFCRNVALTGSSFPLLSPVCLPACRYDTVHGKYRGTVSHDKTNLIVDGVPVAVYNQKDPAAITWGASGAEYIVESTGAFLDKEKASAHFKGGAKKIIMSAVSNFALIVYLAALHSGGRRRNELLLVFGP